MPSPENCWRWSPSMGGAYDDAGYWQFTGRYRVSVFYMLPEYLTLLQHAVVGYRGNCEFGAPEINPKRPYGNSGVLVDIAQLLDVPTPDAQEPDTSEWTVDEWRTHEEAWERWEAEQGPRLTWLHRWTTFALAVVLETQRFEPGVYMREAGGRRRWERLENLPTDDEGAEKIQTMIIPQAALEQQAQERERQKRFVREQLQKLCFEHTDLYAEVLEAHHQPKPTTPTE